LDILKWFSGTPNLPKLIDMDHLMMEGGLLESNKVQKDGVMGDVSINPKPSMEALNIVLYWQQSECYRNIENDNIQSNNDSSVITTIGIPSLPIKDVTQICQSYQVSLVMEQF
jgi:hypothetical protein